MGEWGRERGWSLTEEGPKGWMKVNEEAEGEEALLKEEAQQK